MRFMALPVFVLYLILFRIASIQLPVERYVPDSGSKYSSSDNGSWFMMRQDALACVSFIGITTMAFLCGISSVSAPYSAFFGDKRQVSEVDSDRLRQSILSITDMIGAKELEISRAQLDIARSHTSGKSSVSGGPSGKSSPNRNSSAFSLTRLVSDLMKFGDNKQAQLRSLMVEHDALVSLRNEVEADLDAVLEKIYQQQYQKTVKGKIHKVVFAIFAIYCIYRVTNTYIRLGWWFFTNQPHDNPKGGPRDALVLLIAATIESVFSDLEIGVTGWSRIIGVLMSGAVFIAALNGVLQMSLRIVRKLHKTPSARDLENSASSSIPKAGMSLDLLLVAHVVGVYILSIATTLRFNLPRSMSGAIMAALVAPLKITSVQLWNDIVLGLTSTVTLLIIMAVNRVSSDSMYDDEKGL
nr:Gphrb [Starmerella bombicola]